MTSQIPDQIPDQMPQPGPPGQAAPPAPDGARRCKQPGCGAELPGATGRGAPRLFCGPACSRKWHNENRLVPGAAGQQQAPAAGGPLAGLQQLLAQAAGMVADAGAQLTAADPGRVATALAAADAARRQAQAETAVALARAAQAEVPQIFRTGDPIGFSPERNGIKCRGNRNITLLSSRSRP